MPKVKIDVLRAFDPSLDFTFEEVSDLYDLRDGLTRYEFRRLRTSFEVWITRERHPDLAQ